MELVLRFPPLDRDPGPGQLTAEGHVASFRRILVLQTQFKARPGFDSSQFNVKLFSSSTCWFLNFVLNKLSIFPPLHWHSGFGKLTAQCHAALLNGFLALGPSGLSSTPLELRDFTFRYGIGYRRLRFNEKRDVPLGVGVALAVISPKPPLHWDTRFRDLTFQRDAVSFLHLEVLQFLSEDLILSKPLFQWTWTPGSEYSQMKVTVSPSLASTDFRIWTSRIVSRASQPVRLAKYLEEFHIRQPSLYHRM
ncbi:hypothetical protein EYF80_000647 [Liparis tanakae]|uniref:Uncharacterized protein n=1 Tax=Liparis tanakae TaxID=230148 RepID=A0A4Z2JGG1_9TELE|nr:hypothetical protein EYF80_000647 [Liparis tanakae]